jgi:hypothetical protein
MSTDGVDIFVGEARAYCSFVEQASSLTLVERLRTARERLLGLYSAALSLPSVEPDDRGASPSADVPAEWPGFEDKDVYWETFDPYEHQDHEPVAGSLADDVLDVYRDIRRGLTLWNASQTRNAIWEWRFHFDVHWGDHAVDALRALHRACKAFPEEPRP